MNEGYVKDFRKVEDNPVVCKDNDYFRVWYFLLHNATHKEQKRIFGKEVITLLPGQVITGREVIAKKCMISSSKVERILKVFEIEQQIEQQTCSKGRLISIANWNNYQNSEQQNEQQVNNKWTASEQQVNTNKNVKNERMKEIKKENIKEKRYWKKNVDIIPEWFNKEIEEEHDPEKEKLMEAMVNGI